MSKEINWQHVRKILVVRLRSIGDTVLTTPSLIALREFLPKAQIDILLEDWVAPVLDGFDEVDNVLVVSKETKNRVKIARKIRNEKYDVAVNFHGGTTATFFVRASGAKHRVGYSNYSYSFLYNHRLARAEEFWRKEKIHSAEQQMAMLGFIGVPVNESQKTNLVISKKSLASLWEKINFERETAKGDISESLGDFALIHPAAAFETKQWSTENFASVADFLSEKELNVIAIATRKERGLLEHLQQSVSNPILTLDYLTLPEITALASKSRIFIGNDSGIAHIAAAVGTPSVVIFGSSDRVQWHPWTDAPYEIVFERFHCQPCSGYECKEFGKPKCILSVSPRSVIDSINRVLGVS